MAVSGISVFMLTLFILHKVIYICMYVSMCVLLLCACSCRFPQAAKQNKKKKLHIDGKFVQLAVAVEASSL